MELSTSTEIFILTAIGTAGADIVTAATAAKYNTISTLKNFVNYCIFHLHK